LPGERSDAAVVVDALNWSLDGDAAQTFFRRYA
jgi:hypothetical protein